MTVELRLPRLINTQVTDPGQRKSFARGFVWTLKFESTLWWMVVAPFRCRSDFWSRATAIASLVDVGFYSRRISICGQLNIANRLGKSGLVKDLMHKGHCGNFVMSFESTQSKAFVNTHNAPANGTWCGGSLDLPGITAFTTNRRARSIFATTRKWPTMVSHQS